MSTDTREKLSPSTVGLHWIIAIAMIGMVVFGLVLEDLPRSPQKGALVSLHKSIGVAVLAFAAWRLVRRILIGLPQHVGNYTAWEKRLSAGTHWFLLFATIALPVSGMLYSIGSAYPIDLFGVPFIPKLLAAKVPMLADGAKAAHAILGKLIIVALVLHIAGALKHHIVDRDGTLARMMGKRVTPTEKITETV